MKYCMSQHHVTVSQSILFFFHSFSLQSFEVSNVDHRHKGVELKSVNSQFIRNDIQACTLLPFPWHLPLRFASAINASES